jgi:hypothetical protein
MRQPEPSVVGTRVFRELDGPEASVVFANDLIERLHMLIDDPRFREAAENMFIKTGRFGTGACFPVVKVSGPLSVKVFTSLEAYRSNEKLPAPFDVNVDLQAGQEAADQLPVVSATMRVNREIGTKVANAVDAVRLDAGLEVLAPARDETGYVKNVEVPESQSNPRSRKGAVQTGEESDGEPEPEKFVCVCGNEARSKAGLMSHQRVCEQFNQSRSNAEGESGDSKDD